MRKMLIAALLVAVLTVPAAARPLEGAEAFATAGITVEQIPLSLTKYTDLGFGTIIPGNTESVVYVVAETNGRSVITGNCTLADTDYTEATMWVTGHPNTTFGVSVPSTPVTLSDGDSHEMSVSDFEYYTGGSIDTYGEAWVYVGGKLTVAAGQARGAYTASFDVTVNYD